MAEAAHEPTAPSSEAEQPWSTAEYEAALAHLEHVQNQLDHLRSTIPALVAPVVKPSLAASKAQYFADVRRVAVRATCDVQSFREQWTAQQTRDVLARGKESLARDGDLSKAGEVAKYGWTKDS